LVDLKISIETYKKTHNSF